jgi:hypothetical protein
LGLHASMILELIHRMQTIKTDTNTAFIDRNPDIFVGNGLISTAVQNHSERKLDTNYKTTTQGTIITERQVIGKKLS